MKAVVLAAARARGMAPLPPARRLAFVCWFGMEPRAFARRRAVDPALVRARRRRGWRSAAGGLALLGAARAIGEPWAVPLLLVALSMLVHFGLFTLLAARLGARGYAVPLLFDAPWRARTPQELWTRRWNRGFAEMTALAVHRPLRRRLGAGLATWLSFVASGLLHEVAISLPVRAGYGLPTLYFALQGWVAVRHREGSGRGLVLAALLLPLPVLFHPWFVRGIAVPLLE
jgi:alginate O-acetyltransferase complex protein AlgI